MHHSASGSRLLWVLLLVVLALPLLLRLAHRTSAARTAQVLAASTLLAAAVLHLAAAAEHVGIQRVGFLLVAVLQLVLAGLVLARPTRALVPVIAVVSAVAVGVWWETRTWGLIFGIEAAGVLDGTCVALELVTVASCSWLNRHGPSAMRLDREVAGWALIVSAGILAAAA